MRKAVIPAAGLGTRFLRATKVLPKEILPVVDRPVIEYAIEEAARAGLTEVVLVLSPGKEDLLIRHLEPAPGLEQELLRRGKLDLLEGVRASASGMAVATVVKEQPHGLGDAVLTARDAVGDEPFAGLLPDDIIRGPVPVIGQMLEVHARYGCTVLAVRQVPRESIGRYGAIKFSGSEEGVYFVEDVVEKPDPSEAPSDLAILGRYVLTPGIFGALERTERGAGHQIQLTHRG